MKNKDLIKIASIYEANILNEGTLSDFITGIRSKANELGLKAAGVASNVGNRLANVVRSGEDQKNPIEAQVQKIWNNFRTECLSLIEKYSKNTANLIDFDTNDKSAITQQHYAILKAKEFLDSPQHYIKKNKDNLNSSQTGGSVVGTGGGSVGSPESGNSGGTTSMGGATSSPSTDPVSQNATSQPTSNSKQSVSQQTTTFLKNLRKNPALYKAVTDRIINKHNKKENKQQNESFFELYNKNLINSYLNEIANSSELMSLLVEYDVQQTVEKTKDPDAEDIRYHGAKPLKVEILKFFEQFRAASKKLLDAYDSVQKTGTYQRSTADKKIFITIEAFIRQLARILYIQDGTTLQGKNELFELMK